MSDRLTVLLVPTSPDSPLLAEGDARTMAWCVPPRAAFSNGRWVPDLDQPVECPRALVLAYRGEPVPEGCDRALRLVADGAPGVDRHGIGERAIRPHMPGGYGLTLGRADRLAWSVRDALGTVATFNTTEAVDIGDLAFVRALADICATHLGARVILCDADGREVSDV